MFCMFGTYKSVLCRLASNTLTLKNSALSFLVSEKSQVKNYVMIEFFIRQSIKVSKMLFFYLTMGQSIDIIIKLSI